MIVGITIRNFKAIREIVDLRLSDFHVLVGANGSGKSTFLEAIDFVRNCLVQGPRLAVESRGITDFTDLTWNRQGGSIDIELRLDLGDSVPSLAGKHLHYRLVIRQDESLGVCVDSEMLWQTGTASEPWQTEILIGKDLDGVSCYVGEVGLPQGSGELTTETIKLTILMVPHQDRFRFSSDKLALAQTPADESRYPTANAVRRFLMQGVRTIQLNSRAMRWPCPATRSAEFELDGTNLARVVGKLMGKAAKPAVGITLWAPPDSAVALWTEHLRYALPDLSAIGWARRQADNAEYLVLKYEDGLEVPSWLLSDGTLRMLALTLPAFLPPSPGVYLVEEPENGVHPMALEIILRSLSAIPDGQMLITTHSPLVVQQVGPKPLLCFKRMEKGVEIIPGPDHPALKDWDGTPDLGIFFAASILE
jgi:predicted ATPase